MFSSREGRLRLYEGRIEDGGLGLCLFPTQRAVLTDVDHPFVFFCGGIGAGKSMCAALYVLPEVAHPGGIYWIIGPDYKLPRVEFSMLMDFAAQLSWEIKQGPNMPQDGEWYVRFANGTEVYTKSAQRPEQLHAVPVNGIVVAEAGQISGDLIINRLLPRITRVSRSAVQKEAGWIFLSGTFEGMNTWVVQKYEEAKANQAPDWSAYSMPTWENTVDYPGGRQDPKVLLAERSMTPEQFLQRYGAIPMTPEGLVFKEFSEARHVRAFITFDPDLPVQIWVDPGRTYAVEAVQIHYDNDVGDIVHVFDEIYLPDGSTEMAVSEATRRPWWENVIGGWIDVAAVEAQTLWSSGAIYESLRAQRSLPIRSVTLRSARVDIVAGIERVRTMLHSQVVGKNTERPDVWDWALQPGISRIYVSPRCRGLITEARLYTYADSNIVGVKKPRDANNHAWKAVTYGCVGNFGYATSWLYTRQNVARRNVYGLI